MTEKAPEDKPIIENIGRARYRSRFAQPAWGEGRAVVPRVDAERSQAFASSLDEVFAETARHGLRMARAPRLPAPRSENAAPLYPGARQTVSLASPAEQAATAVGASRGYIEALIGHESGGDANAEAPTSSATGHGQFIDATWLRMMRQYGPAYGFGEGALTGLSDEDVLTLRADPTWSALMIGEYARENEGVMRQRLGRHVREGEVYLGHWLGAEAAARLIKEAETDARRGRRGTSVRAIIGDAAFEANLPVMYTTDADIRLQDKRFTYQGGGRARSPAEVIAAQTARFSSRPFLTSPRAP